MDYGIFWDILTWNSVMIEWIQKSVYVEILEKSNYRFLTMGQRKVRYFSLTKVN